MDDSRRLAIALDHARAHDGRLRDLAREANVGYEWLRKLLRGDFNDPSTRRIERLIIHRERADGMQTVAPDSEQVTTNSES